MNKAKIELWYESKNRKTVMDTFTVQFNPRSLGYSVSANKENAKGTEEEDPGRNPHLQCDPTDSTGKATLSVKLFYHTYYNSSTYTDVREEIDKLRKAVRKAGNDIQETVKITFAWGSLIHSGVMQNFSVEYQMFASDGTPVQAEVSFSICGDDAEWATTRTNQLTEVKAKLKELYDIKLEDPIQTLWAWLYF